MTEERRLELLVQLGRLFTEQGLLEEKEKLLTYWLAVLHEELLSPKPGEWSETDLLAWARKFGLRVD